MTRPVIVGIDLGKNWFHLVGVDEAGAAVFRKKMNRSQLAQFASTSPRCMVTTESCPGSQYWGRVFTAAGHEVRILPAQFVKPVVFHCSADVCSARIPSESGIQTSNQLVHARGQ